MVRAKIWFRCAVVHDPVCPIIVQPALIGWEAKYREIELVIARAFKGNELVSRMKGWITVDPSKVIEVVEKYGRFRVLDDKELVVETPSINEFTKLQEEISKHFGNEVNLEIIQKQK